MRYKNGMLGTPMVNNGKIGNTNAGLVEVKNFSLTPFFFFSSRRRHTSSLRDWSSDVCSSDLSTCNRSELYGVPRELATDSAGAVELFLASFHQLAPAELNGSLYRHRDRSAVDHLFRVAAGLDSMLLGEAEILGQVREAYRIALDHGATGPVLNRMFQGALEVGKRVRNETEIGTRPVSVAFAGVKLAERIFGKLNNHRALIIGAGATSEQVVRHLCDRGVKQLRVLNRTEEHAVDLAARFGGEVIPWENLCAALEWPDLIVTSISNNEPILTRAMIERAMAA